MKFYQQAGQCSQVVEQALTNGVIGERRDGVWLGRLSKWGATWQWDWRRDARGHPIHVWIERPDGTVYDPTRWVLEGVLPYIYEGPADSYGQEATP